MISEYEIGGGEKGGNRRDFTTELIKEAIDARISDREIAAAIDRRIRTLSHVSAVSAAVMLDIHPTTFRRLRLPAVKLGHKSARYALSDIEALIEKRKLLT